MVLFTQFTKATSGLWDAACNEDKRIKYCERCRRIEPQDVADRRDSHMVDVTETEFKKFRYCIKCKRVCYCSKQCQTEDWKDHKHACKIFSQNETAQPQVRLEVADLGDLNVDGGQIPDGM